MEAALAKASLRTHVTLGIVMIGERHGALAMEHAAAVFAELWDGTMKIILRRAFKQMQR